MTTAKLLSLCLAVASLTTGGCKDEVLFDQAFLTDEEVQIDERLVGRWVVADRELLVLGDSRTRTLDVTAFAQGDADAVSVIDLPQHPATLPLDSDERFTAQVAHIGGARYLSIPIRYKHRKRTLSVIFRYAFVTNDEVHVFALKNEELVKAFQDNRLSGSSWKTEYGPLGRLLGGKNDAGVWSVSSRPNEVREYFTTCSDKCWESEPRYILKRKAAQEVTSSDM